MTMPITSALSGPFSDLSRTVWSFTDSNSDKAMPRMKSYSEKYTQIPSMASFWPAEPGVVPSPLS